MAYDNGKGEVATCEVREPQLRDDIVRRIDSLERQLAESKEALALLDENPTFEKIHNAIAKLNMRGILR